MRKLALALIAAAILSGCSLSKNNDKKKDYSSLPFSVKIMEGAHTRAFRCESVMPGMAINCIDTASDEPAGMVLFPSGIAVLNRIKE